MAYSVYWLAGGPVHAQLIVVPNANATTEGNGRLSTSPFNSTVSTRYQNIIAASQFSGITGPSFITQIAFRPDSTQATTFSNTFSNVQINLSTTSQTVAGLSPTFADNVGLNDQIVYSGALTLATTNQSLGATKAFDIVINLQTPFLYNPAGGNLLLDIRNFSGGLTGFFDAQGDPTGTVQRIVISDGIAGTGSAGSATGTVQAAGLVSRFALTATAAPEPGSLALLLPLIGSMGVLRKRRKK